MFDRMRACLSGCWESRYCREIRGEPYDEDSTEVKKLPPIDKKVHTAAQQRMLRRFSFGVPDSRRSHRSRSLPGRVVRAHLSARLQEKLRAKD